MLRCSAMQSVALMVALQRSYVVTLYCEQSPTPNSLSDTPVSA